MPKSNWERITEPLQRQTSGNRFRWWIYLIISGSFFVLAWVLYFAHRQSLSSVIVSSVVLGIFVVGSLYLLRRKPVPLQLSALVAVMMGFCLWIRVPMDNQGIFFNDSVRGSCHKKLGSILSLILSTTE